MLKDRFDGAVVVEGRNDPDTLARLSPTGEWRVGAFEITRLDDDGAVESILEHVFEAVDLQVIFSLLAELDVQSNWCGAGARAQRIAGCCKQSYQCQSTHGA